MLSSGGPARIAPWPPNAWERLRDLRLRALREDPAGFSSTYADELRLTEADWRRGRATPGQIIAAAAMTTAARC